MDGKRKEEKHKSKGNVRNKREGGKNEKSKKERDGKGVKRKRNGRQTMKVCYKP